MNNANCKNLATGPARPNDFSTDICRKQKTLGRYTVEENDLTTLSLARAWLSTRQLGTHPAMNWAQPVRNRSSNKS